MAKRTILPAETLSEDTQKFYDVLNNEPDFSVIVVSCAYLDACLGSILERYLLKSTVSEGLLDVRSGALGTFAARAAACYALGLISKAIYKDLMVLAEIRNEVAHNHLMLSFSAPKLSEACMRLEYATSFKRWDNGELLFPSGIDDIRARYTMTVVLMNQRLLLIALGAKRVAEPA